MRFEWFLELNEQAEKIADNTCKAINAVRFPFNNDMPYSKQYILEEVIDILRGRV